MKNPLDNLSRKIKVGISGLKPEAEKSPALEVGPDDFRDPFPVQDDDDVTIVEQVKEDFRRAQTARSAKEEVWYWSQAMERGNQWTEWDRGARHVRTLVQTTADRDYYKQDEQIAPLILKNTTRATQNDPDIDFEPVNPSVEIDKAAAHESRTIHAHCGKRVGRKQQVRLAAYAAQVTSTVFVKLTWGKGKTARVPQFGQDPNTGQQAIIGGVMSPVGEVDEIFCLPYEIFLDPNAHTFEDARFLFHVQVVPRSTIQSQYGEIGFSVKAETGKESYAASYERRLASINGDVGHDYQATPDCATVIEKWEKPSPKYPTGRLITIANDVLLQCVPWPYDKKDKFPFAPLRYRHDLHSPWGRNAVQPMIPHQQAINSAYSHLMARLRTDKNVLLLAEGSAADPSDMWGPRDFATMSWKGSNPMQEPKWFPAVGDWNKYIEVMQFCLTRMENQIGLHDIQNGQAATDVKAWRGLALLKQNDDSQIAEFTSHIEAFLADIAEWEVALYQQYASGPRIMAMDDNADMATAAKYAIEFKALREGGQARVTWTPGSAMPTYPDAEQAQIDELLSMGLLGAPGDPETAANYFDMAEGLVSNKVLEQITQRLQAAAARKPTPEQVQQQQMQAQQAQEAAALKHATEMAAIQAHTVEAEIALKHEKDMELEDRKFAHQLQIEQEKSHHAVGMLHATQNAPVTPSVSLAGKLDVPAVQSAEKAAGYDSGTDAETKAVTVPVSPQAPGGKPKPTAKSGKGE